MVTGEITNWSEVGGDDGEIVRIGREAGSVTRDGFESSVDGKDSCKYAQELTATGAVISAVAVSYTHLKGHSGGADGQHTLTGLEIGQGLDGFFIAVTEILAHSTRCV